MTRSFRRIFGALALSAVSLLLCLAVLECALRVGGRLYLQRQGAANDSTSDSLDGYRVLCLGESTTLSITTDPKDSYPAQLEILLNERGAGTPFTVINAGMPATNTDRILEGLPEQLDRYKPHLVVAMMGINDQLLAAPEFQVSERLRVFKLAMTLYHRLLQWLAPLDDDSARALSRRRPSLERKPGGSKRRESARIVNRARAQLERGNTSQSEALALQAIRTDPKNPGAHLALGDVLVARGRSSEAVTAYRTAMNRSPSSVVHHFRTIPLTFAIEVADALDGLENETVSLVGRATIQLRQNRPSQAERLARRATEFNPEESTAFLLLGDALAAQEHPVDARAAYRMAANLQPSATLGDLLLRDPETALAITREDAALHPDDPDRKSRLHIAEQVAAFAFLEQQNLDSAENLIRAIEERSNDSLAFYGALTILYLENGDVNSAERYHDRVRELVLRDRDPRTRENYQALSRLLAERGIQLIAMQYPMRWVADLKQLLDSAPDVTFVDNEMNFERALMGQPHAVIFRDLFAGDFGHLTAEGNRLLAESVAPAILDVASRGSEARSD